METEFRILINEMKTLAQQYPGLVHAETEAVLQVIVDKLEMDIVEKTPEGVGAAGGLAGSIHGKVASMGRSLSGIVGTPLAYGEVVELGRKPGKFPWDSDTDENPLKQWVRSKLGVPQDEIENVAFLVGMKIKHHGTEGAFMFRDAWDENERWIMQTLQIIRERVIRKAK